jgi:hypothetical protein
MKTRHVSSILMGLLCAALTACAVDGADEEPTGGESVAVAQQALDDLCSYGGGHGEECVTYVESGCWWCIDCYSHCVTGGCPGDPIFFTC